MRESHHHRSLLFLGVLTAALVLTAAGSGVRSQEAKADADQAPRTRQRTLNLMSIIDPPDDVVRGKWSKTGKLLRCDDQHFAPRIQIRFQPPVEYDFIIQFSQPKLRHPVTAIMPNRHGGTFVVQAGLHEGNDFRILAKSGNDWHVKAPSLIQANTLHTMYVQVRRNSIRCLVDGRELVHRQTDFSELTTDSWHEMPTPHRLGVGCDDPTVFHKIHLTEISGPGRVR